MSLRKEGLLCRPNETIEGIGYKFEFKVRASPILQELGYFGGFGSKNVLGFGCVEVIS